MKTSPDDKKTFSSKSYINFCIDLTSQGLSNFFFVLTYEYIIDEEKKTKKQKHKQNKKNYKEKYYSIMLSVEHEDGCFFEKLYFFDDAKRIIEKNILHYLLSHVKKDLKLFKRKTMKQRKQRKTT